MRVRSLMVVLAVLALALSLAGCKRGVSFDSVTVNRALPKDVQSRVLFAKTDIYKYRLSELAGAILVDEPGDGAYRVVGRVLPEGAEPDEQEIDAETGLIYSCVVDQGAAIEGTYLAFATNLEANQVAQVEIRDRYLVFLAHSPKLADAIAGWVRDHPRPTPETRRWYVQGALLASIATDYYQSIKADASGVLGDTLGAKGNVYNKVKETVTDFRISLELIDMDALVRLPPNVAPNTIRAQVRHAGQRIVDFEIER